MLDLRKELSRRIREKLVHDGVSQKALARSRGLNQSDLSKIKLEQDALTIDKLVVIAAAMGIQFDCVWREGDPIVPQGAIGSNKQLTASLGDGSTDWMTGGAQ